MIILELWDARTDNPVLVNWNNVTYVSELPERESVIHFNDGTTLVVGETWNEIADQAKMSEIYANQRTVTINKRVD